MRTSESGAAALVSVRGLVSPEGRLPRRRGGALPVSARVAMCGLAAMLASACAFAVALTLGPTPRPELSQSTGAGSLTAAPRAPVSAGAKQRALDAYQDLPLAFAPNHGQADGRVRYLAQGAGYSFYFTTDKVVLSFTKPAAGEGRRELIPLPASLKSPLGQTGERQRGVALELRFPGASPEARLEAGGKTAGSVNYLAGAEGASQRGVPTHAELTYRGLWPGIDLHFRGENGTLKYEFHLAPGADPRRIRMAYAGAQGLSLAAGGSLAVGTRLGALEDARPASYQRVGGHRVAVDSRYALGRGTRDEYGFALGAYDRGRPLVLDPGLAYSSFLGGTSFDEGVDIALDHKGNAYVTGGTGSADFPTTPGAFDSSYNGGSDAFVTKLNAAGSALAYSTFLGGASRDTGRGIAVDRKGNAYVSGVTNSPNFPTTPGAFDTTHNGDADGFVAKLNAAGSALTYSTFVGGPGFDQGVGIAVDGRGNAYVTGGTNSPNFPTTPGAFDASYNGGSDAFVAKLNAAGSALTYSTFLGGPDIDLGVGLAVDGHGHAYVTGSTRSATFPATPRAFDTTHNGFGDGFVAKLNAAGSALAYSTFLGGTSTDVDTRVGIAVDHKGNAYLTGDTESADFPTTPGAFDTTYNGGGDAFVTRLNAAGSALAYSTFLGGASGGEGGRDIALDGRGNAHVVGLTTSADFPTTVAAFDGGFNGVADAFVTKLATGRR